MGGTPTAHADILDTIFDPLLNSINTAVNDVESFAAPYVNDVVTDLELLDQSVPGPGRLGDRRSCIGWGAHIRQLSDR